MTTDRAELARIQRDYPAWVFAYAADVQVWIAVSHPPQNREHVLAAPTLEELRVKLEQAR